jgi:hypothetical protein
VEDADALLWHAVTAYEKAGEPREAIRTLERFVEEHPGSEFMASALAKLARHEMGVLDLGSSLEILMGSW